MHGAVGSEAIAGYLSTVVDSFRKEHLQVRTRRNQRVQVNHRPTVFPQKASNLAEVTAVYAEPTTWPRALMSPANVRG